MEEEFKEEKTSEENQEVEKENSDKNQSEKNQQQDTEKLEKDLQSAIAQKKSYREKFKKLKSMLEESEEAPEKPKENAPKEERDTWKEKVDFMLTRQQEGDTITKEDVELLEKLREDGQSLEEAYQNNSDLIELRRQQRIAESKPQEPSGPYSKESTDNFRSKLEEVAGTDEELKVLEEELENRKHSGGTSI